jgi:DNA polymerase IV
MARKICPALIVMPSDYETYSLFPRRMFYIIRRFTPEVEEYSIGETFADITGMRRALRSSYEGIARRIREEDRFFGETKRRHLGLPILHVKT